jgi:hypothetical protein
VIDPAIFRRTEMKNFLVMLESQNGDGIENYRESLEYAEVLLTTLENNLRK